MMTLDEAIALLLAYYRQRSYHGLHHMGFGELTAQAPNGAGISTLPNPRLAREAFDAVSTQGLGAITFDDPRGFGFGTFTIALTVAGMNFADLHIREPMPITQSPPVAADFGSLVRNGMRGYGLHAQSGAVYLMYRINNRGYSVSLGTGVGPL